MKRLFSYSIPTIIVIILLTSSCNRTREVYNSSWEYQPDRIWIGPEFWANRLQDWTLKNGELQCINSNIGARTIHLLTHQVGDQYGQIHIRIEFGINSEAKRSGNDGWAGLLIGAGEGILDYRGSALIHHSPGKAGGIIVAVNEIGQVVFLDNSEDRQHIGAMQSLPDISYPDSMILDIDIYPDKDSMYTITANAIDPLSRNVLSHNDLTRIPQNRLRGNIALIANHIEKDFDDYTYSFKKLHVSGTNLNVNPKHRFGPFMGVLHTLSNNTLKLTAQLPPVGDEDEHFVRMWHKDVHSVTWTEIDSGLIRRDANIVTFKIEDWNSRIDHDYRLSYRLIGDKGRKRTFYYSGIIKADPEDKPDLIVGAFACISHSDGNINGSRFSYPDRLWFPHSKFVESVKEQKADILFFVGDQIYEGRPTPADLSSPENTELDYLYKWYIFLWSTGELMRNTPVICIPDDHDVYHGNIWGANGKAAPAYPPDSIYPTYYKGFEGHWQQDQGGYKLRASTVNMIQATQTSHLPDPYDPTTVEQGIEVYYTDLNYGRISFAILEDRKFKSAPAVMLPAARVVNGFPQNKYISGRNLDNPNAKLLGERQLEFIENWTSDWKNTDMKAVISQTILANLSTYPDTFLTDAGTPMLMAPPPGIIPKNYKLAKDMDSNGWPQTGRNKALRAIRKGYAVLIAGDQHLGSLIHMGADNWDDAGYSFCVPAIGNLWPRRWFPQAPGFDHKEGMPMYTGKYFDGFGNRMNVYAVGNPVETGKEPGALYNRAVGYGIIKFNKPSGEITFECWRRDANPKLGNEDMFPGWPKTIKLFENNLQTVRSWLPLYEITGLKSNPVFQVIDEASNEIVYTLRVPDTIYQPGVFSYSGNFTIKIGNPDTGDFRTFEHVRSTYTRPEQKVSVDF